MSIDDVLARLKSGLDEDVMTARRAMGNWDNPPRGERWAAEAGRRVYDDSKVLRVGAYRNRDVATAHQLGVAKHIATHDPARVLRQAEAIREVIEWHMADAHGVCISCGYHPGRGEEYPCATLRALASIYPDPTEIDEGTTP